MTPSVGAMNRMTDELLVDRAFASIPMLGSTARWEITSLAGGIANRSWLLAAADCKLILRVPVSDTRQLGVDRRGERAAIDTAARAGLAPPLVYFDVTTGLMVSEYLEGRVWGPADAHDADNVARLARRLRLLHDLEPPGGARRLEYSKLIPAYRKSLAAAAPEGPRASAAFDGRADRLLAALFAVRREIVLCHNDVHHRNIVDGLSLWFIDWEYAAMGDGFFDLASFACYHELDSGERERLLDAYLPGGAVALAGSFDDYCWLFDYMYLLWLELTATDVQTRHKLMHRLASGH